MLSKSIVSCQAVEGLAAPGLVTLGANDAGAGVPRDEDSNLDGVALVFHDMIDYIKDNKLIAKVFLLFSDEEDLRAGGSGAHWAPAMARIPDSVSQAIVAPEMAASWAFDDILVGVVDTFNTHLLFS